MAVIDPELTVATGRFAVGQSGLLLRQRVAHFLKLFPVRRVLQHLVILRERIFDVALLHEYIAPRFQRISPVRSALMGGR